MRPLTIDMHRLEFALDGRDIAEYYTDLESGEIRAIFPGDPPPGAMDKYDVKDDRYLHIEPLDLAQSIAMREAFLFTQHDPIAHAVLSNALRAASRYVPSTSNWKTFRGQEAAALPDSAAARIRHHRLRDNDLEPVRH